MRRRTNLFFDRTLSLTIVRRLADPSTSQKRERDFQTRLSDNHLAEWIECFDFGLQVSRDPSKSCVTYELQSDVV